MKKLLLTCFLGFLSLIIFAQAPSSFKYQTVIRDNNGELISNQDVSFRISIIRNSDTGTEIYNETHNVTSSSLGLCNLEIGNGNSPSSDFDLIDWGNDTYFLKIGLILFQDFLSQRYLLSMQHRTQNFWLLLKLSFLFQLSLGDFLLPCFFYQGFL